MSNVTNEAAYVKAPISGKVIRLDVSTTVAVFQIPPAFQGCQCTWTLYPDAGSTTAISADVAFGLSTVTVIYDQQSSVTSQEITVAATTGARVYSAGGSRSWVMPMIETGVCTHFAVDCDGNGNLEIQKG